MLVRFPGRLVSKVQSKATHAIKTVPCASLIRIRTNEAGHRLSLPEPPGPKWRTGAVSTEMEASAPSAKAEELLAYDGIVFDMDGTLTKSNIDFVDMRNRTGISFGDLFTTMEAWPERKRINQAMDVILELEAKALLTLELMDGLRELLDHLRDRGTRVAIVTRNTPMAVNAFFALLGEEYRPMFSQILTREFDLVKPDFRLMDRICGAWGVEPSKVLMVGDSVEDVEVGNAAGSASCLIEGGGNETSAAAAKPPPGSLPSFKVRSLLELRDRVAQGNIVLGRGRLSDYTRPFDDDRPGAPPPGRDLLDFVYLKNYVKTATSSYPRMGSAAGGLQASPFPGEHVLHLQCGAGALTKILASQGLQVIGADSDVSVTTRRGLLATAFIGQPVAAGSLTGAVQDFDRGMGLLGPSDLESPFDVVVYYHVTLSQPGITDQILCSEGLDECWRVLRYGGRLILECLVSPALLHSTNASSGASSADQGKTPLRALFEGSRFIVKELQVLHKEEAGAPEPGSGSAVAVSPAPRADGLGGWARVRVVCGKPGAGDLK